MKEYTYAEKSNILIDETIDALRNKPVRSTYLEKLKLAADVDRMYANSGLPQPLVMSYGMNYMLENCSCPVKPQDILVGRFVECIPNDEEEAWLAEYQNMWHKRDGKTFLIDGGHITLDWEEILRLGISGYIVKAEQALEHRMAEGAPQEQLVFLQGMIGIYRAYRRYIIRYAESCEAAGMEEAAIVCRNLADNPPATFLEGMQLILFITSIYSIYSAWHNATLCCGRMDDLLFPYYQRDIAAGILTREEAGYIIDDFNCKSAIILGRGEHQMSGGTELDTGWYRNPMYDSPTYVIIGGYSNRMDYRENTLTKLFLERIHPRLENPVYVYRRTKDCPTDEWAIACDKLRTNSTLLIYNDEVVISAMKKGGIGFWDAINYTIHGCNWPDVGGMSVNVRSAGGPIPERIYRTVFDKNGRPQRKFASMEDIYEKFTTEWRAEIQTRLAEYRSMAQSEPPMPTILACVDCFMRDTIEKAQPMNVAVPYRIMLNLLRHVGTAADMMAAMEDLLFGSNPLDWDTLCDALNANFVGYEDVLKRCRKAPKYGRDDDRADRHAVRLMKILADVALEESVNPETGKQDVYLLGVTITDSNHLSVGAALPATPDGRLAKTPVSENLSPTKGTTESVTALLNSVSKIDFSTCAAGTLNIRMPKNLVAGDDGLDRLMILLETYFENGGMQAQLSIADTAELRDAQAHPENYPDLMVRVTGYSAVFVDMCRKAQDDIICRDEVS